MSFGTANGLRKRLNHDPQATRIAKQTRHSGHFGFLRGSIQPTTQGPRTNAKILPLRGAINLTTPTNHMRTLTDCFGREVRLTDERLAHILERPELDGMDSEVEVLLRKPQFVRLSGSDATVRLFYAFYPATLVGGKWLCVVVKYEEADAFVVTAYLTNRPKAGDDLWPTK